MASARTSPSMGCRLQQKWLRQSTLPASCSFPVSHASAASSFVSLPVFSYRSPSADEYILLNDFTCRETRLHNADWFIRMITLGSIQRYAVYFLPDCVLPVIKIGAFKAPYTCVAAFTALARRVGQYLVAVPSYTWTAEPVPSDWNLDSNLLSTMRAVFAI